MNFLPSDSPLCDLAGLGFSSRYRGKIPQSLLYRGPQTTVLSRTQQNVVSLLLPWKLGGKPLAALWDPQRQECARGGGEPFVRGPRASGESRVQSPKPVSLLSPNRAHNSEARMANEVPEGGKNCMSLRKEGMGNATEPGGRGPTHRGWWWSGWFGHLPYKGSPDLCPLWLLRENKDALSGNIGESGKASAEIVRSSRNRWGLGMEIWWGAYKGALDTCRVPQKSILAARSVHITSIKNTAESVFLF